MPIQPFTPFSSIPALLPDTITLHTVLVAIFTLAVLYWLIFSIVGTYHWIRYSHASTVAYPAVATHLVVSLVLIGYAFSALI